jgi:hypothetical protein
MTDDAALFSNRINHEELTHPGLSIPALLLLVCGQLHLDTTLISFQFCLAENRAYISEI